MVITIQLKYGEKEKMKPEERERIQKIKRDFDRGYYPYEELGKLSRSLNRQMKIEYIDKVGGVKAYASGSLVESVSGTSGLWTEYVDPELRRLALNRLASGEDPFFVLSEADLGPLEDPEYSKILEKSVKNVVSGLSHGTHAKKVLELIVQKIEKKNLKKRT